MPNDEQNSLSYEFFPPKTEKGVENLKNTRTVLASYNPEFYSVTFGAGGTTQATTIGAVTDIQQQSTIDASPHISCIGSTKESISTLLKQYQQQGINRLVALRGDLLDGMTSPGEFQHASDLVEFIRQQTGDHFTIAVAAYPEMHPESANTLDDFHHFKSKVDAGADFAITQYFFNSDSYFRFLDLCNNAQLKQTIVPGIMPISNFASLCRFSDSCGAEIPRWIRKSMDAYEPGSVEQKQLGHEIVLKLLDRLSSNGVKDFHFYTMNQHALITRLIDDAYLL
ncbi:MAG: methylenetetrahydrofolate reductase [NAD(P)H] [Gammaproteobacteria bacterium]|nr:methylenetetrahydrofolate reductase [NAD(P)H] [Gammaproteobacteria bacterium]